MSENPQTSQLLPMLMTPVLGIEHFKIACLAACYGVIVGSSSFGLWIFIPTMLLATVAYVVEQRRIVKAIVSRGGTVEVKMVLRVADAPTEKHKNILFRDFPPPRKGAKVIAMDVELVNDTTDM